MLFRLFLLIRGFSANKRKIRKYKYGKPRRSKRKIIILASRVKNATTTLTEDARIIRAVDLGRIKNRAELANELSEAVGKSIADVGTVLASDDSDRLADEIIDLLKK